ncbi:hypothetical protein B5807_07858 [Epicoccum nigrum]|uniref:Uncharacterized protein n=1 Tax=Epicoccum nigrum TaxID=105696 RepID=A0A1Y2LX62_EPING|nr:hypothetical protein B5807_07858 [Epicoccum nigrum]
MATIDSPAHADPSAIRLTDYPSSESEQEPETQPASQVKKRSGEGGKRHVNKHYKSAEFVDSESDISDSPTKHRSTHTSAGNNTTTTPTATNRMRINNYSWGASASQPLRKTDKRPLPSPTRSAAPKRARRGPFGGESDSESNGDDDDSDGEVVSPQVTAGEVRSESPVASSAKPAAAAQTGKKFNMSLFRKKAALKQKVNAGNTGQGQLLVDAKDTRVTPARTTPAETTPVETSKIPSLEYSDDRQRGHSSVSASMSASTPSSAITRAPVWDPLQVSAPKVSSRKISGGEPSAQTPPAKTLPVQEHPTQKAPARKMPAHRTSALRPSAQALPFSLKKPMKKSDGPTKIQNEPIRKLEEPVKIEVPKTDRPAETLKTAAPAKLPKISKPVDSPKTEPPKTDKPSAKTSKTALLYEPPKIDQLVEPAKTEAWKTDNSPTEMPKKAAPVEPPKIPKPVEPTKRSSAIVQLPPTSQTPHLQVSTPTLIAEKSEAIAVQPEQDTIQPEQDVAQPNQDIEQPGQTIEQREQDTIAPPITPQATNIPEAVMVQPEQALAQPEQDIAQLQHDVAIAQPEQITAQPEQITAQPEQITAQPDDTITLPTPLPTPTASPFFEYTLHTSFSTPSHSTTFEHPTHPLTSAHATASLAVHFSHQTQLLSALGMQGTSSRTATDKHGLTRHEAVFKNPYDPSRTTTLTFSVSRAAVGPLAHASVDTTTSIPPVISREIYALRLWTLLDTAPDSDDEPDTVSVAAESRVRVHCPLPPVCTELHTTLDAANRAAKRVQFHLSHAKEVKGEKQFEKQWRVKNLAELNRKVEELGREIEEEGGEEGGKGTGKGEAVVGEGGRRRGYWFSRFAGTELEEYELRVEAVGVSGPRNL